MNAERDISRLTAALLFVACVLLYPLVVLYFHVRKGRP